MAIPSVVADTGCHNPVKEPDRLRTAQPVHRAMTITGVPSVFNDPGLRSSGLRNPSRDITMRLRFDD